MIVSLLIPNAKERNNLMNLSTSDMLQLISIVVSSVISLAAITISIFTLRQNSKMIEESSRPYIGIYGLSTYINGRDYYIIVKNFGQSVAHIDSFSCGYDLSKLSKGDGSSPFNHLEGSSLVPGQSYRCVIDFDKTINQKVSSISFRVKYSSETHTYEEFPRLKIDGNLGNYESHAAPRDHNKVLRVISETLQDQYIKSL